MSRVEMVGFLEYDDSRDDEWRTAIRLVDEGAPGKAGWMPLVMDDLKPFHGKAVRITVEDFDWATAEKKAKAEK